MRIKEDYFMTAQIEYLFEMTESIYKKVFRYDLSEPGFVVIDLGTSLTSEKLRACMVMLKNNLNQMHTMKVGEKLNYQWMGRFDQQETTKFHLDNAADQSFLMLGYEPTTIISKLYFADYIQFYKSINISEKEYFEKYNPIFSNGENVLKDYITEIEDFRENNYKIVLMNNSNTNLENQTIGVFHKAEIINKDSSKERVINSTMIYSASVEEKETYTDELQQEFITTNKISKK